MRKLFTLLMLTIIVSFSFDAAAQTGPWQWTHPTPQGNTIRWVKYWDANNWYAAGYAGVFMKTTNAGTTWTFNNLCGSVYGPSGQRNSIFDAHFFNQSTGVAVGYGSSTAPEYHSGIMRTTNGGTNWDTVSVTPFTTGTFYQVYFTNNLTGYASGSGTSKVYRTNDGGLTWNGLTTAWTTAGEDVYSPDSLNIIVATTAGNVQKSTDAGATWTMISTGVTATLYKMEFANANTGFVTGSASAFRYTTNAGLNWTTPTNTGLVAAATFYDMDLKTSAPTSKLNEGFENVTFPPTGWTSKNILGTNVWNRNAVIYHSGAASAYVNYQGTGGEDWLVTPLINGISTADSLIFWITPNATGYAPDSLIVKVSTTDTATASFTSTIKAIDVSLLSAVWYRYAVSLSAFNGQNIYIAFRHLDSDGCGMFLDDVAITPVSPPSVNAYLTGNNTYIYKTTNTGATWDTVGFLSPTQPWTSTFYGTDLSPYGGDTLLTGGALGFFNRRAGSNFTEYTTVLKPGTINDVWAASSTGLVITVGASSIAGSVFDQITRSTDGGTTWTLVPYSTTSKTAFNCIQMIDNNTGWACGTLGAIYKTTNAGANWDSVSTGGVILNTYNLSKIDFVNSTTGWVFSKTTPVGDSATIFKTTDAGLTWAKQKLTNTLSGSSLQVYSADMVNATTGYLVNYTPRPYHTIDGGNTWTLDSIPDAYGGYMYDIKMTSPTTGYIVGGSGRVYKTTNGTIWDTLSIPTRIYTNYALDFLNTNVGYIVGSTGTAFMTINAGLNWTSVNTNGATIYNVYMTPDTKAFAVGSSGFMFKNNTVITSIAGNEIGMPTTFRLEQNYPNPFNPTTTIKFSLPKTALVSMKIYDVAGREVMRLINNQSMNAGYQTQYFNGSMLSSGVYFYSLIVDNNLVDTKKMVLIK